MLAPFFSALMKVVKWSASTDTALSVRVVSLSLCHSLSLFLVFSRFYLYVFERFLGVWQGSW